MTKRELKRENKRLRKVMAGEYMRLHAADPAHNSIVATTQRVLYRTLNEGRRS